MKRKARRAPRRSARRREQLEGFLAQVEGAQLVRRLDEEELAYLFKHALVQDSAYATLMKQQRKHLHHLVAQALIETYPTKLDEIAARVALHYAQAGEAEQTALYAERAGDAAASLFAYPEAHLQYATALNALEPLTLNPDRARQQIDLLIKDVPTVERLEGPDRALAHLARAEMLFANIPAPETGQDRVRRARLAFWQGDALLHNSQPRRAIEYMQQVLAMMEQGLEDETLAAIPANVMGRALAVQGKFAEAQPLLERAAPALEQTSNWREWVLAKGFLALTLAVRGDIDAALAQTSSALGRAQELGTLMGVADSYGLTAMTWMQAGEYGRAVEAATTSLEHAQQLGDHLVIYIALNWRGWAELRLGAFDAARVSFAEARRAAAGRGDQFVFADWFGAAEAELELEASTPEDALVRAEAALAFAQSVGGFYSQALVHRVAARALAARGHLDAAAEHWREAWQLFENGDARLEAARTRVAWGKMLRDHGDQDAAYEHFEKAAAQFEASGLTRELEETRALLNEVTA